MKKILSIILALSMIFVMTSCFDDFNEDDLSEVANPIVQCQTAAELTDATGVSIDAPKGATDVVYSYIDSGIAGEPLIAQVEFSLKDKQYCYRAKETAGTSLYSAVENDVDAEQEKLSEMMEETIEECGEFAGLYDEWKSAASVDVAKTRDAVVAFNKGRAGFIAWLDVAPGFLYCLSMTDGATQKLLMQTAEKSFVPMQGEAK